MTERFEPLASKVPAFADLWNISDLAAFAALVAEDKLAEKAHVDLSWLIKDDGYALAKVPNPKKAETLVVTKLAGNAWAFAVGGVTIGAEDFAAPRAASVAGKVAVAAVRPGKSWQERKPVGAR